MVVGMEWGVGVRVFWLGCGDRLAALSDPNLAWLSYSSTVQKAGGIIGRHPITSYFVPS